MSGGIAAAELRQFVERYERLESEKAEIADQMKEVMAEAKGRGFDTKVLRKLIALRKRDPSDVAEEEAVLALYREALGMGGTPLGEWAEDRGDGSDLSDTRITIEGDGISIDTDGATLKQALAVVRAGKTAA